MAGSRLSEFLAEWRARRAGRRHVPNKIYEQARGITGSIGFATSRAWEHTDRQGEAYLRSLDEKRIPPSLHISERDRVRAGDVIPLVERCIEDHGAPAPPVDEPAPRPDAR